MKIAPEVLLPCSHRRIDKTLKATSSCPIISCNYVLNNAYEGMTRKLNSFMKYLRLCIY